MSHQDSDHLLFGHYLITADLISYHSLLLYHTTATLHFPASSTSAPFCLGAFALAVHLVWNALAWILCMFPTVQDSAQLLPLQRGLS